MSFFQGAMVALVTPFKNGQLDESALRDLVEWHIAEGMDVLVPCGTTGESPTLNYEEHDRVIQITIQQARGRVPILAGTGSNSTAEAITMTRHAKEMGADGSLQVTPYYNKPSQEGLFRHFTGIAESVDLPMFLYNVPSRTGVSLSVETIQRCAKNPRIVGIKEACGDLEKIKKIITLCGPDFDVVSGEDAQNMDILKLGGAGMISVTANVVPQQMARLWDAFREGTAGIREAEQIHDTLMPLHEVLFLETNPVPVKTALALMQRCSNELRLPLCAMTPNHTHQLEKILKEFQLI